MSVPSAVYASTPPQGKARSLEALTNNSMFSQLKKHLGSKNAPLLPLEPSRFVLDELHLLLRIGDVLLRNVILQADHLDQKAHVTHGKRSDNNIKSLELLIRRCGVSFSIAPVCHELYCYYYNNNHVTFQAVNENNRPVSGMLNWTALTRKDKHKVLKNLPTHLPELLPSPDPSKIASLWKVGNII